MPHTKRQIKFKRSEGIRKAMFESRPASAGRGEFCLSPERSVEFTASLSSGDFYATFSKKVAKEKDDVKQLNNPECSRDQTTDQLKCFCH